MDVRCCDACKKFLQENKVKHRADWWRSRRLELCEECYEKVDKLIKETDEKNNRVTEEIRNEYIEKLKELGVDDNE